VLDAGANFGWYTTHFARYVGEGGKVFAFEPIYSTFKELEENIKLNHISNAALINQALGDKKGETSFFVSQEFRGSGGASRYNYYGKRIPVTMTTLDDFADEHHIKRLDFIKADIEGGEFHMLLGGQKTLERFHPRLVFEIQEWHTERFGHKPKAVFDLLAGLGYRAFAMGSDGKLTEEFDPAVLPPELMNHGFYFEANR
jgi:FkbM family methyltransferase